ncbi:MAG: rod shape-determining protein RodA [Candidatus Staskawiczbacteria bacterium]|nr:rod shape-determining protein RodA [Candidatus Staskawiczbacteria bacterium]
MRISSIHFKKLDWVLIFSAVLISAFGLAGIWSTSLAKGDFSNFIKQLIFFGVGFSIMILISFFDYRILRNNPYLILVLYFLSLALLAGLQFFAPIIRGTRGWYKIGFITLDPIEIAKIILIILLAKYFSVRHVEMYKLRHILISGLYVILPSALIFIKPDLGGAMILWLMWIGVLLVSGIKLKHFLILFISFCIVAGFAYGFVLEPYQKERITAFLFPYDVLGSSWSQTQTKISIGSGRIFGEGLGQGSQVQYGFLPEPHTDFIFSVISQEWGFIGVLVFFILYLVLIWRILKIAIESDSNFPRLFAVGFAIVLISQFLFNIGMNLVLLPVVGIYLPFVSYGGSGLISNFISLGILQSIRATKYN